MTKKIQPGDIILQDYKHPNKFINWFLEKQDYFDDGPYNHAMIVYSYNQDTMTATCLESAFNGVGFRDLDLCDARDVVLSPKEPIDADQIQQLITDYYLSIPKRYDYVGLLSVAFSTIVWKLYGRKIQFMKSNRHLFCSELVASIYKLAGRPLNVPESLTTPNDLFRSDMFNIIKI